MVQSCFTTSGHVTERVYSYNPGAHIGPPVAQYPHTHNKTAAWNFKLSAEKWH